MASFRRALVALLGRTIHIVLVLTMSSRVKPGPLPAQFHEATRNWFLSTLGEPTRAQALGWKPVVDGDSTLILAPTGSGKTIAAFLAAVDQIMFSPVPDKKQRCRVVYVSPLKALAVDIERNLRAPIAGILQAARALGVEPHVPSVEIRTGDTPQKDRVRMMRTPPDILITTPESLFLILTSKAAPMIASAHTLIVDEIHSLVATKRGAHLFLSLERLEALRRKHAAETPLQRIGLSATQRPLEEVARLLGGFQNHSPRPVTTVDAGHKKTLELRLDVTGLTELETADEELKEVLGAAAGAAKTYSVWPKIQERILQLIQENRSTMIFVNSRRLAERLANALNELSDSQIALAHHGSLNSISLPQTKRGCPWAS